MDSWNVSHDWKAYDPFDGLSSPLAGRLTYNFPWLRIALQQFNRRFPLNIRPIIGIKPETSSKAMGFFAQGYLKLYDAFQNQDYLTKAKLCLKWLIENHSSGYTGYCWGNHFEYQSRGGRITKGVPSVVWTGLIGHAFLDAYDCFDDEAYFKIAESICTFILNDLPLTAYGETIHIGYTPEAKYGYNQVHNSSVIAAGLLARVYARNKNIKLLDLAKKAIGFTVSHQLSDGAWFYGENPKFQWVDSFHTGYVLESVHYYSIYSGDETYQSALEKGFHYYVDTFFAENGIPKYYNNKMRPLDIQCASQGIQTLVNLRRYHSNSIDIAKRVASWTIKNMYHPSGYFYFRKYPFITNKTPTLHWGQATMFAALSILMHSTTKN
jgi:hypothetical protein